MNDQFDPYQYQQPYNYPMQPVNTDPQPNILVFGILSLALGGLAGIILGAIGRSKGKKYVSSGGTLTGASKTGYVLSLVGIIMSIVSLVYIISLIYILLSGDGIDDILRFYRQIFFIGV